MCRWGFFIQFFRPKTKRKRKRPRNHRKIASKILRAGISATSERVIEWGKEGKHRQTPAERRFSDILTEIKSRHSFRCQQVLFGYIIDFYAPQYMLAIEIDGGYHDNPDQIKKDTIRTVKLNNKGISVLRFTNKEVLRDPKRVMFLTQEKLRSCCRVNKIKKSWRHRNKLEQTRDIETIQPTIEDPTFPKDSFQFVWDKRPADEKSIRKVILRRSGIAIHEIVEAMA